MGLIVYQGIMSEKIVVPMASYAAGIYLVVVESEVEVRERVVKM